MRILSVILFGIVLASCSRTGGTSLVPTANGSSLNVPSGSESSLTRQSSGNHGYKLLYAFNGGTADGEYPYGELTALNGKLYGMTAGGGAANGAVFELSRSGKEKVIYAFKGGADGAYPAAGLLAANGVLYGTTEGGGGGPCAGSPSGCGTVFEVSTSGKERVLHAFNGADGAVPIATPVLMNGKLYGTTQTGGGTSCASGRGCGTVFELSKSGKERVLHAFTSTPDGANPYSGLLALNGKLYGTTFEGGTPGFGTVFEVSSSGHERVVYSFLSKGQDGENPYAGVIAVNGKLYGTTQAGGTDQIHGTVYEVSLSGKERVLHSFTGGTDGSYPEGGLFAVAGVLYGTTSGGGLYNSNTCFASGCGTVFKVTTSGTKSVLYAFQGGADGKTPYASLIALHDALYGTTVIGGPLSFGTVFKILP